MKNNKSPKTLPSRLTLVLLLSILSCTISPFFPKSTANANAAPFDDPTAFIRRIPLASNDLVYSSTTGKIYASIPSSAGSNGNSIATIDPATGAVTNTTFIGSEPKNLALSDDGHTLYVWLEGAFAVRRFDTLTNTPGIQFSLGSDPTRGRFIVRDLAVAPGNPGVLAVSRGLTNGDAAGVAIFDDGVRRPNVSATGPNAEGPGSIAFSASAAKLYASSLSAFQTITIDAAGATLSSTSPVGANSQIEFSNGLIFTSSQLINPDTNTLLGTFAGSNSGTFVPDGSIGRAFYVTSGPTFGTFSIKAFDINTFLLLGSITVTAEGAPFPLIRWGANGLAFRTFDSVFIIQTSLIPSAGPVPTPTPTPSPTPSPSPSPQAPAFFRRMRLASNDLIYSQSTQRLYASVASTEGSTGNSITELDPVSGSITNQTFVGSEPTQLGQSDDGATLWVGLEGSASIRSYNILTHTAGTPFLAGRDNSTGPYSFSDIAVTPGNPSVIAVARRRNNASPAEGGVAIFDNGVQRPNTGPVFGGSRFITFASPSLLYGNDNLQGFSTMSVDNSGVTVNGTTRFSAGNSMVRANGLVYGASGEVLNPTTGEIVGTFTGGFTSDEVLTVDVANGRVFFLSTIGTARIRAYDINTFLPVGFINIPFSTVGTSGDLVRWGTNGLAYRTDSGDLVLIETALVNATVPVPSPTPTPSPTPSPSPPYIPTFVRRLNQPANNLVLSEATQALYASVPASAGANGNSITKINPVTATVGPSVFIGSEPNRMAISNDGQTLWVHLNGANAARRFDVLTETPGLQFTTSAIPPTDMEVVPGSPQSLALANGGSGLGITIYDDGVKRPNTGDFSPGVGPIEFGASASVLYGYNSNSFDLVKFLVDSSGVTVSTITPNLFMPGGSAMKFLNGILFTGSGRVVDPENKTWLGKFAIGGVQIMAVDAANHRVFYAAPTGSFTGGVTIRAFDSNTFLPLGSITVPNILNPPVNLVRWGVNGLAFNTVPPPFNTNEPSRVYLVESKLVSNAGSVPVGLELEREQVSVFEGASPLLVKVTRSGDDSTSVSVDYATSNGTATAGADYTAATGTLTFAPGELTKFISIPITDDNLFENGDETFNLSLTNPTNSAVLLTPATTTVTINDSDSKPGLLISSNSVFFVPEGDSGTSNLTFKVVLTNPTVQTVTVNYATSNGSAAAGSDYVASSGTITIPAGTSVSPTVSIPINGDTTVEPDEFFNISLTNATNVLFASSGTFAAIVNDDATVELTDIAFGVNEDAGFKLLNVTRAGDTSRTATVFYSTGDTAGLQSCTVSNFKASERCDYGTAVGTLQFAVGETTKLVVIPVVDDVLVEGGEVFTITLSSPTGALLGSPSSASITIVDNDTTPATQNPIDGVTPFITQQYIDFLGRLPDSIGLANWTDTLGNCPNGGFGEFDNPSCDRVHVSAGFFLSEEFQGRGYFAYKFYEVGFDRRPTYAEFAPDVAQVGGEKSPEAEVISKAAYTDAFVQRPQFKNRYDLLSNSAYVDALEINAEVPLTNKAALVAALNANQKTRAQVLREIVELQSVNDKFFIRAFVAMQYFGYLRRDPDTIGYNNWINTLTADPSNFRHMIFGFIFSDEYRHRFGP